MVLRQPLHGRLHGDDQPGKAQRQREHLLSHRSPPRRPLRHGKGCAAVATICLTGRAGMCCVYCGISVYIPLSWRTGSTPRKTPPTRQKHKLSLAFGDRIFEDDNHLVLPSIRPVDGEERFKVVGQVGDRLFTGVFVWRTICPASSPCEGATRVKKEHTGLPADPTDAEDFDVSPEAMDRGQRARLIRRTRAGLGLSQTEFASRFHVPVGTLRDWEQARATAPDFAVAYVRVIGQYPEMVAKAVA